MKCILVLGATGTVGRALVAQLAAVDGLDVRAMVRNPAAVRMPQTVQVLSGDLTVPESLDRCLEGVESVFMVWVAPPDAFLPALERIAKHARHLVFLSAPLKTQHPLFQQPNPARSRTEQMEKWIEASGLEWTYLRPGMFAANSLGWWAPQLRAGDVVRWPYLETPTAPIDERDIAAVAVRALCEDGHGRAEYVLTGPESLSQRQQIATIGHVTGRSLRIEEIPPEEWLRQLPDHVPAWVGRYPLDAWAAAAGQPAFVSRTVEEITEVPPRTFEAWVTAHAAEFERG